MRTAPLTLALFFAAGSAHADVPPSAGYVDTCTVQRQRTEGIECGECDRLRGTVDAECAQAMTRRGWSQRCEGGGATVGRAVYCSAPPPPGFDPSRRGCASCAIGSGGTAATRATLAATLAAALALGATLALRRREGRR